MRAEDPRGTVRDPGSPSTRRRSRGLIEPGGRPSDRAQSRVWVGWREWVALPGLGIPALKAKIDTGARTSALHAFDVEVFREHGRERVRFSVHPLQGRGDVRRTCEADVVDRRMVTDSGGHRERRIVIRTPLSLGGATWDIELTLASRDEMRFRMLLGRSALAGQALVNPAASYRQGRDLGRVYRKRRRKRARSGAGADTHPKRRRPRAEGPSAATDAISVAPGERPG